MYSRLATPTLKKAGIVISKCYSKYNFYLLKLKKVKIIYVYCEYILNKKHMNNELEIYFAQFGYQLFSSALWVKSKYVNLYFSDHRWVLVQCNRRWIACAKQHTLG